jgi:protein tyrosine phosphatase (PTP) superfamily phosphohydrolase (DUF442 family)
MMKKAIIVLSATAMWALVPGCQTGGTDGVTAASPKYDNPIFPPDSDTYEVVGVVDGLSNFVVKYDDNFYRGGIPWSETGYEKLKEMGVKTIISVVPDDTERAMAQAFGLTLVEIPFDKAAGVSKELLDKYLAALDTQPGPFYVHCHGGTHRGGTLGAAYRYHKQGWDKNKVLVEYARLGGELLKYDALVNGVLVK